MTRIECAAIAAIAVLALAGCEQSQRTTQTPAPPPASATASPSNATAGDPSVPPADVALSAIAQPAPAAGTRAQSQAGSETASHSAMTRDERDAQMPMKGQVNDHSTPDRAKEGDQPNTASKEPGGQEAKPGNRADTANGSPGQ